ncbi:sialate O-acetylesterase [Spirosoma sp. HMF3257]|uniref:Sialate O-acetylesterase n=1 Tax=Spirosoma telluris TaxID=2183553 RepID=A0A327NCY3_9BACT|nr:sialate O-acetylesterase [Spirosoma telluris]RAI73120.1 sialate O-acetylesterase [Spirosoma telluris]
MILSQAKVNVFKWLTYALIFCVAVCPAYGQLRLADVWQSGMVIQRDKPIPIWGWARPGQTVRVQFENEQRQTVVKADSSWSLHLQSRAASATPTRLTIRTDQDMLQLTNLLIGDVWICAGQSNIAFPVINDQFAAQTLRQPKNRSLRLFNKIPALSTYNVAYEPADRPHLNPTGFYQSASWQEADSVAVRLFSAVGYYFGQTVQQSLNIPIGLINLAVGGSPTEAWMRPASVITDPITQPIIKGDWWQNAALEPWCSQRGHENLDKLIQAGCTLPADLLGYQHPFKPGFLYKSAIEPLLRLPIKGIIWYQGESNALSLTRAKQHERLFPLLVTDWRKQWQQGDMPFYFCQLSSIGTEKGYKSENWPWFRDSQRRLAEWLPNVGMVITSDVGNPTDVHPLNKRVVGERLAREALVKTYGQQAVGTPELVSVSRARNGIRLRFRQTGTGLRTADTQAIRGFSVGDSSGPQQDVPAHYRANRVFLCFPKGKSYSHIYYGWKPYTTANLVNSAGLPVSTFTCSIP